MLTFNIVADGVNANNDRILCYADDIYLQWFPLREGITGLFESKKEAKKFWKRHKNELLHGLEFSDEIVEVDKDSVHLESYEIEDEEK